MKKYYSAFLTFMILCFLCLCPIQPKAASVKLNKTTVYLKVKKTDQLKLNNLSSAEQKKVTYKSKNPSIVKVSKTGKLTAKAAGKTTITASYNGNTYTCKVNVNKDWSSYNGSYKYDFNKNVEGVDYWVIFKQSSSGKIKLEVQYFGVKASPIYTTKPITLQLDKKGKGSFRWIDSWENSGTGTIQLKNKKITVKLKQTKTAPFNRATLDVGKSVTLKRDTKKTYFTKY